MRVECICDYVSLENSPLSIVKWANNTELEITVGKTYIVLAMTKFFGVVHYYIISDVSDAYPLAFPHYLFKLIDKKISECWIDFTGDVEKPESITIEEGDVISFREWSMTKDLFYGNIIEEDADTLRLLYSYRDKMLRE